MSYISYFFKWQRKKSIWSLQASQCWCLKEKYVSALAIASISYTFLSAECFHTACASQTEAAGHLCPVHCRTRPGIRSQTELRTFHCQYEEDIIEQYKEHNQEGFFPYFEWGVCNCCIELFTLLDHLKDAVLQFLNHLKCCLNINHIYLGPVTYRLPRQSSGKESEYQQGDTRHMVLSLDWEDPLAQEMATHSSIFAWKNSMDRGAWRATVHGDAKNQTRLSKHTCTQ